MESSNVEIDGELLSATDMSFARRLRQARRQADLTQAELAKACGVSRGAVALWECADPAYRTKPADKHLSAIAAACNVTVEWLTGGVVPVQLPPQPVAEPLVAYDAQPAPASSDIPDIVVDGPDGSKVFVFVKSRNDFARGLARAAAMPPNTEVHVMVLGETSIHLHQAGSYADALAQAVKYLKP